MLCIFCGIIIVQGCDSMGRIKYVIFSILFILFTIVPVNAVSDYWKDIVIKFNPCEIGDNKEVVIQLFVDGVKEGEEIHLNSTNNYSYTFSHLTIFKPHSPVEYKYDVKIKENGNYRLISPKHKSYKKEHINKWVQVVPENIKAGHTYVITTDNWNYENNGFSEIIYLRGDITAKGAAVLPEYNIIDNSPSYYVIDGEPIENTKWTVSNVPKSDPNYEEYKDYLVFTNESGEKRLTLTGYGNGNYIFRHTGKSGFNEGENSWNANKVVLSYVPGSKGRFYIGSHTLWDNGNNNDMRYLTLSGQNQYQAGTNKATAAQFKAYEHIDKDVIIGVTEIIEESMCPTDTIVLDRDSNYKKKIDINLDCQGCEDKMYKGVVLQLFVDGKKVEDGEVSLNSNTGFSYTFNDLPFFYDGTLNEIDYEIKVLLNGKYYSIPSENINNKQETIHKWIQVFPKDIKEGKTYVLAAENKNFESNGLSRYVYLVGNISSKEANVLHEYNVIDGKKTYYIIDNNEQENTKWTVSPVPNNDPNYEEFKDYLMFTNETENKNLTLTGYNNGGSVNYIFKCSSKIGYNDSENSWNTNKVKLIPSENYDGKFIIGTHNVWDEDIYNMMQYITLNDQLQFGASDDSLSAAEFMLFEYVEKEIVSVSQINLRTSLCDVLNLDNLNNPNTGRNFIIIFIIVSVGIGFYLIIKKNKYQN